MNKRIIFLAVSVFAIGFLVRWYFYQQTDITFDDAFISLRYVKNLIEGQGFVFNVGEKALGTTSPFFVILLSAIGTLFKFINLIVLLHLISAVLGGLSAILIFLITLKLFNSQFATVAAALTYALAAPLLRLEMSGMESSLVVFILLLSLYFLLEKKLIPLGTTLGLALLTRSDLIVYVLPLGFFAWKSVWPQKKRDFLEGGLAFGMVILAWEVFSLVYFKSLLPGSIGSKMTVYSGHFNLLGQSLRYAWEYLFGPTVKSFLGRSPIVLALAIGVFSLIDKKNWAVLIFSLTGLAYLFLTLILNAPLFTFPWYLTPFLLSYYFLAGIGFAEAIEKARFCLNDQMIRFASVLVLLLIVGTSFRPLTYAIQTNRGGTNLAFQQIGLWLKENTSINSSVMLEPIGQIGYLSDRRIIDEIGLVSPQMQPFLKLMGSKDWPCAAVKNFSPDYLISGSGEFKYFEKWQIDQENTFVSCNNLTYHQVYVLGSWYVLQKSQP